MIQTTKLGGTAADVVVAKVAHGLMTMTMRGNVPDEQAFESIKSGVDSLPPGVKMMLNSGEYSLALTVHLTLTLCRPTADFYGEGHGIGNLELLARFYDKYPEYADRTFLSVKVETIFKTSVERSITALRGTKKIDLFQPARLMREFTVEDHVRYLSAMIKEGKFDHLGFSEVGAASLRRGHAVYPISVAEIEISPMSYEEETKKVIAVAAELDIAINAYSPLGHGLTTGNIKTVEDLNIWRSRRRLTLHRQNFEHNQILVAALVAMAGKKGCTPAQLSIAWVGSLGDKIIPLPGSSRKERTLENLGATKVDMTTEDMAEIASILEKHPVRGHRYFGESVDVRLWG
ncbi:aldo/keto reductase [Epithele typhae]|uniref:aldo/keto reductase n=1 Tax=Epithele typhae TaxID=378194 RepID=UPI0020081D3B|nr:aldo/keto reductase [Epithele typhae]KAH9921539.1 aldo/keto reductase [Epithele typhae]